MYVFTVGRSELESFFFKYLRLFSSSTVLYIHEESTEGKGGVTLGLFICFDVDVME